MNLLSIIEKKQNSSMNFFNNPKENKNFLDNDTKNKIPLIQTQNFKGKSLQDSENYLNETKSRQEKIKKYSNLENYALKILNDSD